MYNPCSHGSGSYGAAPQGLQPYRPYQLYRIYEVPSPIEHIVSYSITNAASQPAWLPVRLDGYLARSSSYAPAYGKAEKGKPAESAASQEFIFEPFHAFRLPQTRFIRDAEEVRGIAEQAFSAVTGTRLPRDIAIHLCSEKEMALSHKPLPWHPGIAGFSINRDGMGVSEAFVLKGQIAEVMITLGHELGHLASSPLTSRRDEEAKAFAFELAWIEAIIEGNIGELASALEKARLQPAENGLHNVAFGFVKELAANGELSINIFREMAAGFVRIG